MGSRDKVMLSAAVVLALLAYIFLALRPALAERSALKAKADELERRLDAVEEASQELADIQEKDRLLRARTGYVPKRTMERHVAQVIGQLDVACRQADMLLESTTRLPAVEGERYMRVPFLATTRGDFASLLFLMQELGRVRPVVAVDRLAIERLGSEQSGILKVQLRLVSYVPKEEL